MNWQSRASDLFSPLAMAGYVSIGVIWWQVAQDNENPFDLPREPLVHGTFLLFLGIFAAAQLTDCQRRVSTLVAIGAVAVLLATAFSRHGTGPVLMIMLAAMLRADFSLRTTLLALVGLNTLLLWVLWQTWGPGNILTSLVLHCGFQAFAVFAMHSLRQAEDARDELRVINAELLGTREMLAQNGRVTERLALSRELHDVAGHTLTALKLGLRGLKVSADQADILATSVSLTDDLLNDIRGVVGTLRESDGIDIAPAIQRLTGVFAKPSFHIDIQPDLRIDDTRAANALVLVVTEVVTNTVKHAQANNCWITVTATDDQIVMVCRDDGIGGARQRSGFGLTGMREHAELAGCELTIDSPPGRGTTISLKHRTRQ